MNKQEEFINDEVKEKSERIVPIKENFKHGQPFHKIPSKYVTAKVLAFFGFRHEVCQILQVVSHQGRAYFVQQEGLSGFL